MLKFLRILLWSVLFIHLVFYWIQPEIRGFPHSSYKITQLSAQFAKELCGERVDKKLQKIARTFF